ncbi:hypothetical protein [Olivibacter sitiensis]|uniref:hypothetical protein n=1 Tax=Olivibacter sitiensis TaxID=376470 RepID=UPI00041CABC7|nr:hypothetical protein [Olivibacter sitiensis]
MKTMYLIAVLGLFVASCSAPEYGPKDILGSKWSEKGVFNGKPFEFVAFFRTDGSFEGIVDGKPFVSGSYELLGDTVFFSDPICNVDYKGSYKLLFKRDSLTFSLIADTCTARREGTDNIGFVRIN